MSGVPSTCIHQMYCSYPITVYLNLQKMKLIKTCAAHRHAGTVGFANKQAKCSARGQFSIDFDQ